MIKTSNLIDSNTPQLIERENLAQFHKQMPTVLASKTIAAIGALWTLSYSINITILTIWFALICSCNAARYLIDLCKHQTYSISRLKKLYFFGSLISGVLWGAILLIASDYGDLGAMIILSAVTAFSSAIALISHAHYPPAYYAYSIPSILGMSIAFIKYDTGHNHIAIVMTIVLFFILISYCRNIQRNSYDSIDLKLKNNSLLLEVKKQAILAQNANINKSLFLAAVSHDLRQPFHALSLFVDSIQESSLNQHTKKIIANIRLSISAQERLFTEFLDISKLDAGAVAPNISCFSTKELFYKLKSEYKNIAREKGLKLSISNLEVFIRSDQLLCERIIRNILSNAINYTLEGSISVDIFSDKEYIKISITDTGIGINENKLETIFSEFEQLQNPERDSNKGLGLGLAIVKKHCDLLDLDITVASIHGQGSTFTITFRRCDETHQISKEQEYLSNSFETKRIIKGISVLVIENDILVLEATKSQLETLKCQVICAHDADEAINKLRKRHIEPDIILCDLHLQKNQNGIEAIKKLNLFFKKSIPSIIITGDTGQESIKQVEETDSLLLHKPIQKAKLIMALNSLLKTRIIQPGEVS